MTILITGSSRGIGAELALEFASEGHRLLLVSRTEKRIRHIANQCNGISGRENAHVILFDINDLDNQDQEFDSLLRNYTDSIDAIINNAGHLVKKPFEEITSFDIHQLFNANVFAPGNLIKTALPFLRKSDHAHVVNITSMGGFQGSSKFRGLSYYSASKAALSTLTECLAEEYKEEGISFNALSLGAVGTEMFAEAFPGFSAPLTAREMAGFVKWFTLNGNKYFNGKNLPVSISTP